MQPEWCLARSYMLGWRLAVPTMVRLPHSTQGLSAGLACAAQSRQGSSASLAGSSPKGGSWAGSGTIGFAPSSAALSDAGGGDSPPPQHSPASTDGSLQSAVEVRALLLGLLSSSGQGHGRGARCAA